MQTLWPIAPVSIAIIPDVESTRALAMNVGGTLRGPFSWRLIQASIISSWPPAPEPKTTPTSSRFSSVISKPESASACFAARHAEMHRALAAADGLRVHPLGRVEVADLAGGLRLVARDVELRDLGEAGLAADQVVPRGRDVVADRADDAQAGDDDAAVVIGFAHARVIPLEGAQAGGGRGEGHGEPIGGGGVVERRSPRRPGRSA